MIDDDEEIRRFVCQTLIGAGFSPDEASGGAAGLQLLAKEPAPRAVILDLRMPSMSGEEVLRAIRREHPGLVVIVASGLIAPGKVTELLALGANACLKKSELSDELVPALERALPESG